MLTGCQHRKILLLLVVFIAALVPIIFLLSRNKGNKTIVGLFVDDLSQYSNSEIHLNEIIENVNVVIIAPLEQEDKITKQIQNINRRDVDWKIIRQSLDNKLPKVTSSTTLKSIDKPVIPYQLRKDELVQRTKVKDHLTMSQIFALPSKYKIEKKNDEEFSVTAVIGLYKRTGLVKRWFESLVQQTHPPKIVWAVFFSSPISKELEQEIEEHRSILTSKNIPLYVNKGEMQLKYFGRFQLALQTTTKYVVVFDDDCLPQPRFFEAALHTINTEQYRGILGTKGTPWSEDYFYGPVSKSDKIIEADVVGGSWFMEREWVKLMYREKMFTWATGEDWHLCVNSRKYANIRSFVMPVDPSDSSTHSFSSDYLAISDKGDTTNRVTGTGDARGFLRTSHNTRGDVHMNTYQNKEKTLMVFVENQKDATLAISLLHRLNAGVEIALASHNKSDAQIDVAELQRIRKLRYFNDFMVGREYETKLSSVSIAAETMYHFDIAIQQTQSSALLVLSSTASSPTLAVITAAQLTNIPIINIISMDNESNCKYCEIIKSSSLVNIMVKSDSTLENRERDIFIKTLKELF